MRSQLESDLWKVAFEADGDIGIWHENLSCAGKERSGIIPPAGDIDVTPCR